MDNSKVFADQKRAPFYDIAVAKNNEHRGCPYALMDDEAFCILSPPVKNCHNYGFSFPLEWFRVGGRESWDIGVDLGWRCGRRCWSRRRLWLSWAFLPKTISLPATHKNLNLGFFTHAIIWRVSIWHLHFLMLRISCLCIHILFLLPLSSSYFHSRTSLFFPFMLPFSFLLLKNPINQLRDTYNERQRDGFGESLAVIDKTVIDSIMVTRMNSIQCRVLAIGTLYNMPPPLCPFLPCPVPMLQSRRRVRGWSLSLSLLWL